MKIKAEKSKPFLLYPGSLWQPIADNAIKTISELDRKKKWEIEVRESKDTRTNQQNRYLWGVVYKLLSDETGNDPEDLHEYFLGEHFGWEEVTVLGKKKLRPKRRSRNSEKDIFFEFVEFIRRRAAMNGYYIPDPDPYWRQMLEMDKRAA